MSNAKSASDAETKLAGQVLRALLRPSALPPQLHQRFKSIQHVHVELRQRFGFVLVENRAQYGGPTAQDGKPCGHQLIWRNGRLIVRAKTRGEAATKPFRPGLAHLSVCLIDGKKGPAGQVDTSYNAELGKFDALAVLQTKGPPDGAPWTWQTKAAKETWSDNTHFLFPDLVCEDAGVERLTVGHG